MSDLLLIYCACMCLFFPQGPALEDLYSNKNHTTAQPGQHLSPSVWPLFSGRRRWSFHRLPVPPGLRDLAALLGVRVGEAQEGQHTGQLILDAEVFHQVYWVTQRCENQNESH